MRSLGFRVGPKYNDECHCDREEGTEKTPREGGDGQQVMWPQAKEHQGRLVTSSDRGLARARLQGCPGALAYSGGQGGLPGAHSLLRSSCTLGVDLSPPLGTQTGFLP